MSSLPLALVILSVSGSFAYDDLGNATTVSVGNQPLSTTAYTTTGDKLPLEVTYGNGGKVAYERDDFKRVKAIRYDNETTPRYSYAYDANGTTAFVRDHQLGRTVTTEQDMSNRPMRLRELEGRSLLYESTLGYNEFNQLESQRERVGGVEGFFRTEYTYEKDMQPTALTYKENETDIGGVTLAYDQRRRVQSRALAGVTGGFASTYNFVAGGHGTYSTTNLVSGITQPGQTLAYTYDAMGNITAQTRNGVKTAYKYDVMGQLTRESNPHSQLTTTYAYDRGGNITSKSVYPYTTGTPAADTLIEKITYTYGDANWKDKLTKYNGVTISYDQIGNPLHDGTWAYTWQAGRQLTRLEKTGETIDFNYNASGLRVRKESTSRGVTEYTLNGTKIVHQQRGNHSLHFWYDDLGRPGLVRYNGKGYYYVYSLQGDVLALVDKDSGSQVVEYGYDAWGKQAWCTGTMAETLGVENPFRYRGYVYDEETGWYYLRSRYYWPEVGRLGNADTTLVRNLFSYCSNMPVDNFDPSGHNPNQAVISVIISGGGNAGQGISPAQKALIEAILSNPGEFQYSLKKIEYTGSCLTTGGTGTCDDHEECNEYEFGYYKKNGVKHICCAYLMAGIFGGYKSVGLLIDGCEIYKPLESLDQLEAGMEVYQGRKHVGRVLECDFGDGVLRWGVLHSSTKDGQGPVIDRLDEVGSWTHYGIQGSGGVDPFFLDPNHK